MNRNDESSFELCSYRGCIRMPKDLKSIYEDEDVANERARIHRDQNNTSNDVLRLIDLVKVRQV